MSRIARLWKGAGVLTLGGLLLSIAPARGDQPAPPSPRHPTLRPAASPRLAARPNARLQRVAFQQDPADMPADDAAALPADDPAADAAVQPLPPEEDIDPAPAVEPAPAVVEPGPAAGALPPEAPGTIEDEDGLVEEVPLDRPSLIERAAELDAVAEQALVSDINARIQRARALMRSGQPDAALEALRLAQNALASATQVAASRRALLERQLQMENGAMLREEERFELERAELLRRQAAAAQRERALEALGADEEKANQLMTQFNTLMSQGQYNVLFNGGLGDISKTTAPFYDARIMAMQARALQPRETAPRAGIFDAMAVGFYAQSLAFDEIKEYRYMLTLQDVERAAIPFPDTTVIEYPDVDFFRRITEVRVPKYESTDLVNLDQRTKEIMGKLDQVVSMPFDQETPLGDVIKYIKTATSDPTMPAGLPIYLDPIGLQEAEATEESPVKLNLEGVPLKRTLDLILRQLGLIYVVKDGLLHITARDSEDKPVEIRVYPVADLSLIPMSLMMGGGGGGGMGGGGGGMGGGMGGV